MRIARGADIYAASEEPIAVSSRLAKAIGRDGVEYAGSVAEAVEALVRESREGCDFDDGGGSVSQAAGMLLERLGSGRGAF